MTDKDRQPLYRTWRPQWRPRARRSQMLLAGLVALLAVAVMAIHGLLVVSPWLSADLDPARLGLPYQSWYLRERPTPAARGLSVEPTAAAPSETAVAKPTATNREFLAPRPNLVPQPADWDAERLKDAALAYLCWKAEAAGHKGYELSAEASAVAQELAERYATDGPEAIKGQYEGSLLADGWLWEVWRGCQATIYTGFPKGQIEAMGCGPQVLPARENLGLGLSRWQDAQGETAPVFAVVWRGGEARGGTR